MGHHSYITIGRRTFLYSRDGYSPELAALFQERERVFMRSPDEEGGLVRYGYFALAWQLRQRLHVQGFTADRARAELSKGIERWRKHEADRQLRQPTVVTDEKSPPDMGHFLSALRNIIAEQPNFEFSGFDDSDPEWEDHERSSHVAEIVDELRFYLDTRILLRLLLEPAPDEAQVGLDLHELTGCCVELDANKPIAEMARATQLSAISTDSPLIVLTEGRTDSRLLQRAMSVTHPHLVGFIRFIEFDSASGAEGSVGALSKTTYAFIAAGVANRFVAIADNDTEGHNGLAKLKRERLPGNCRVTHYPDLPSLNSYPTVGPYSQEPILADLNGRAGSLEMYFGHDALTIDGRLAPVQWRNYNSTLDRYHGTLMDQHKKAVQDAFSQKVDSALKNGQAPGEDWTGVRAIINHIVHVFD